LEILNGLGEESGLRQMVAFVIEKAATDFPKMFGD
jgi:hypothetical protein